MAASSQPFGSHRCRVDLGGLELVPLLDARGSFTSFADAFPGATAGLERNGRGRYPELFSGSEWVLPFRAFLVRGHGRSIVVDTGIGPPPGSFLPERQGRLPMELAGVGQRVEGIDLVLLTHLHVDHVGWTVDAEGRPRFANARYVVCADDWQFFSRRPASREVFAGKLAPLERAGVVDLVPAGEADVAPGVTVFPTPGHTPGHMSVRLTGERAEAVVIGDVAVHPLQIDDPALGYQSEVDQPKAAATRIALLRELAGTEAIVAAGHFHGCGLGRVVDQADGFAWSPLAVTHSSVNICN